jgi:DNA-binding NarL/FixJ family response regulator
MTTRQSIKSNATIRVAIVDDHRLILDGLASRLNDPETGLEIAATETSWASLVGNAGFPFDVVVLDLHLEDGIPIGTKLRALATMGSAGVVMSRHADSASVAAAMRAGAFGFVPKSESADELISAIWAAANSVEHVPARLASEVAHYRATPDARLGKQEQRAIQFYASGRTVKEVAAEMNTTEETVKSYIKRGRRKLSDVGVDGSTRQLLRKYGVSQGWVSPE